MVIAILCINAAHVHECLSRGIPQITFHTAGYRDKEMTNEKTTQIHPESTWVILPPIQHYSENKTLWHGEPA